jgi:Predicted transcription factor, homolog of eukaryotic MBF1
MPTFGERLKELRLQKSIMQKDLANELSITTRSLKYYEDDQREPNLKTIKFLVSYFNVSADYLLGLSDNPERR